jgi:hypothetical protein
MLCWAGLVRTDVLEERITAIIMVTRTGELETTLTVLWLLVTANVVPSSLILVTQMMEVTHPPKRWFLQEPHDNIPEASILHSQGRENVRSFTIPLLA